MTNTEGHTHRSETTATQDHKSTWTTVLDTYRERKAERASIKAAERELSSYVTPSDLADLDSMLERCADESETVYGPIIERIRLRAA